MRKNLFCSSKGAVTSFFVYRGGHSVLIAIGNEQLARGPGLGEFRIFAELIARSFRSLQPADENLVSNAVKSARHRVTVTVSAADLVRISVRDDGPGLPEAVVASLRNPAVPLPLGNARSGLGLRLCLEIAQALDTPLEGGVPEGGGTEISFTLPRAET